MAEQTVTLRISRPKAREIGNKLIQLSTAPSDDNGEFDFEEPIDNGEFGAFISGSDYDLIVLSIDQHS